MADARDAFRPVDLPRIRDSLLLLPPSAGYVRVETQVQATEHQRSRYTLTRPRADPRHSGPGSLKDNTASAVVTV